MRKLLPAILAGILMLLTCATAFATALPYPFRAVDDAGNLVAGATITISGTALTSGTPGTVTAYNLATGASVTGVSVTYIDLTTGDYVLLYDETVSGELYFPVAVTKGGSTITASRAIVPVYATADSQLIKSTSTSATTAATQSTAGATSAATAATQSTNAATSAAAANTKLGTPAGASVSADILTANTAVAALPTAAAIATAVWGKVMDGSLSAQDCMVVLTALGIGVRADGAVNTGAHTQSVVYKRQDGTTTAITNLVTFLSNNVTTSGRTPTIGVLP